MTGTTADLLMSSTGPTDVDERVVAQAALDAAEEQLRSLCASHAGTFVSVERRGTSLESSLQKLQQAAKHLEPQVEAAQHALEDDDTLSKLSEKHRVRRRTLLQHSSLLELLELPSLMDACVRSNLYEEALSIASFANALERRHSSESHNVVVINVVAQIRTRQSDLRRHLLHRLKQDVTMPQCLEVVTALRRLNSIDLERMEEQNQEDRLHESLEYKLQVDFLEARDAWLQQVRPTGAASAGAEQLLDTIERYRTRVFEIATQFNAIFRASPGKKSQHQSASSNLLSMWTTRRVHSFLSMLQHHNFKDSAEVRDALEASTFFATSLGRLGADFTAQLPPYLEPHMLQLVTQHWTEGVSTLQETLQVCREAGVASPLTSQTAMEAPAPTSALQEDDLDMLGQPPRSLLALPALARLVNSILAGLNELRRCLLPGLFVALRRELQRQLKNVAGILQTNERAVLTPGLRGEAAQMRDVAARMVKLWDAVVEPYCVGALELALGNVEVARKYLKSKEEQIENEDETDIEDAAENEDDEENVDEKNRVDEESEEGEGNEGTASTAEAVVAPSESPAKCEPTAEPVTTADAVCEPSSEDPSGEQWGDDGLGDDIYD